MQVALHGADAHAARRLHARLLQQGLIARGLTDVLYEFLGEVRAVVQRAEAAHDVQREYGVVQLVVDPDGVLRHLVQQAILLVGRERWQVFRAERLGQQRLAN